MTRTLLPLLLTALLLAPAAHVESDPPLDALAGAWLAETFNGQAPPAGMTMTMSFINADFIVMEIVFRRAPGEDAKVERTEVEYTATADGALTLYYDKETKPEGDKATWKVEGDKLTITNDKNEVLVFKKKPAEKKPG